MPDAPELTVLMLQQRSMAQMIERQLTHRAAARSVSGLAAVLAHEIKNPLSGIRGAAQLLEPALSDEDRALAQLICAETDRIRNLVDRMEVFGDERPLAIEPVNIHSVLDHVKKLAETGFARGVRIVEEYDPSLPHVPGNRDKLVQAFLNLVKNAAEAMGEGTRARPHRSHDRLPAGRPPVGAGLRRPRLAAAADRGRGQRPGHGRDREVAPVRSVRHHQAHRAPASVWRWSPRSSATTAASSSAKSEPRRTVFRVLLPMQDRRRSARKGRTLETMARGTILIADDDAAIRTVLNQALARAGYSPRATGNAATLWRWVSQGEGDIVITDVIMPDENGFDLIPRIKKQRPELPIIVMSAQNTLMTAITAAEKGAYEYLPKPFDLGEVVSVVGRALAEPGGGRERPAEPKARSCR